MGDFPSTLVPLNSTGGQCATGHQRGWLAFALSVLRNLYPGPVAPAGSSSSSAAAGDWESGSVLVDCPLCGFAWHPACAASAAPAPAASDDLATNLHIACCEINCVTQEVCKRDSGWMQFLGQPNVTAWTKQFADRFALTEAMTKQLGERVLLHDSQSLLCPWCQALLCRGGGSLL